MSRRVSKSKFKPRALAFFREIEDSGEMLIITDRGRPVLKIMPYEDRTDSVISELRESVVKYSAPMDPVGSDDWEGLQ